MHPADNPYESENPKALREWCGWISLGLSVVSAALLALGIIFLKAGNGPFGALAGLFSLLLAAFGVLFGLVGMTKPRAASFIGLLGNLSLVAFIVLNLRSD